MMDPNPVQPAIEQSTSAPEKPPIIPLMALGLPLIAVLCCSLVYLPIVFTEAGVFFYWRDFLKIGIAEAIFCFGGIASLAAIILGVVALVQKQRFKAASFIGIIFGFLVGISVCLVMPFFFLLMFSSQ